MTSANPPQNPLHGLNMTTSGATLSQLRLLILSPENPSNADPSAFPPLLKYLTSTAPSEDISSFAGYTSHTPIHLRTKYYKQDVSIWCDELPSEPKQLSTRNKADEATGQSRDARSSVEAESECTSLEEWKEQMLSSAAREVRLVIGGIILILPTNSFSKASGALINYVEAVHELRQAVEDDNPGRDIASIFLLQPRSQPSPMPSIQEDLEKFADVFLDDCIKNDILGWDVVHWLGRESSDETRADQTDKRNEFGEKVGIARVMEVLESVDWSVTPLSADEDGKEDYSQDTAPDFRVGRAGDIDDELQQEMLDLKVSIMEDQAKSDEVDDEGGEDLSVEQMAQLQSRVLAIREAASQMSGSQKEAFAKREIDKIVNEL